MTREDKILTAIMFTLDWCSEQEGASFGDWATATDIYDYMQSVPHPTPEGWREWRDEHNGR